MSIFDVIAKPFVAAGKWTGKAFTSGSTDKKIGKGFGNFYDATARWMLGGGKFPGKSKSDKTGFK